MAPTYHLPLVGVIRTSGNTMAEDGGSVPPWVNFILDRVDRQFDQMGERLDRLVTQDAFRQEQDRVNQRLQSHDRELGQTKASIESEATARATENQLKLKEENAQKDRLLATQKQTQWQWFLIFAGPIVAWFLANLRLGG